MLDPNFPPWLVPLVSPLLAAFGDRIPARFKPLALGIMAAGAVAAVVALTPLELPAFMEQTIILYGILAGGYTAAKVGAGTTAGNVAGPVALAGGLIGAATPALAQSAGDEPALSGLLLTLLAYGTGWLARLIREKLGG